MIMHLIDLLNIDQKIVEHQVLQEPVSFVMIVKKIILWIGKLNHVLNKMQRLIMKVVKYQQEQISVQCVILIINQM